MDHSLFSQPLRGIIPPMVTPLRGEDELDHAGLASMIEHLIASRVAGLFLLGTTGEGPALSYRLRGELIERSCELVAGRVPVFVGVSDPSLEEAVQMSERAADAGAQAIVCAPPYYLPLTEVQVERFFLELARRSPLPLLLYNMPSCTKLHLTYETVRRCAEVESIVGIKDSSGDIDNFERMLQAAAARPDWTVLIGPERLLAESVRLGGHGGVSGGANVHPRLLVDLYDAAATENFAEVARLDRELEILDAIYDVNKAERSVTLGIKCALAQMGLCSEAAAQALGPCTDEHRQRVAEVLQKLQLVPTAMV